MNTCCGRSNASQLASSTPKKISKNSVKIVLLGEFAVGKSSIMRRLTNEAFLQTTTATVGVDFVKKQLDEVELVIWDTAGQERFRALTTSYIRQASIALLVYDASRPETLENLEFWRKETAERQVPCICVIANKIDTLTDDVKEPPGFREKFGAHATFLTLSCKTDVGMDKLRQLIEVMARAVS
jgi:small GTP-binding protein